MSGPIVTAVKAAIHFDDDYWRLYLEGGVRFNKTTLYWAMVANEAAINPALNDNLKMSMCTKYGRNHQVDLD